MRGRAREAGQPGAEHSPAAGSLTCRYGLRAFKPATSHPVRMRFAVSVYRPTAVYHDGGAKEKDGTVADQENRHRADFLGFHKSLDQLLRRRRHG